MREIDTPPKTLTPREIEVLTLIAIGKKRAQIASALSISEETVKDRIKRCRRKLRAVNTTHAVALAVTLGLVTLSERKNPRGRSKRAFRSHPQTGAYTT